MITLITGAPGAGKTAALVLLLQSVLAVSGRQVYVHGIPDLKIPHELLTEPSKWPSDVPDGSIVIIDEVQNVWRPRGPGQAVPDHVKALETHRHRGLDFYIITQGPNLVDSNVRALVGRHIHLRDIGFLGRWWYEWPECADNCRIGWKNAPIKKKYKLPKVIFGQYKSASLHVKPIRSFPKMFVVAMAALVGVAVLSYSSYASIRDKLHPAPVGVAAAPGQVLGQVGNNSNAPKGPVTAAEYVASFTPRLEGLPQTAPRYDEATKPTTAPYPAACINMGKRCECYTQQGTKLPVPLGLCTQIVKGGFFMDWNPNGPSSGGAVPVGRSLPAGEAKLTGGTFPEGNPSRVPFTAAEMPHPDPAVISAAHKARNTSF